MIISQNVSFNFTEELCTILEISKFLYFQTSYDLENLLWRHDEREFLNISLEPQLIKSHQTWPINRYKLGQKLFWNLLINLEDWV